MATIYRISIIILLLFNAVGMRIWVGYLSGTVQVLDLEGKLLGGYVDCWGRLYIHLGKSWWYTWMECHLTRTP